MGSRFLGDGEDAEWVGHVIAGAPPAAQQFADSFCHQPAGFESGTSKR
jgi:hypothetical protein